MRAPQLIKVAALCVAFLTASHLVAARPVAVQVIRARDSHPHKLIPRLSMGTFCKWVGGAYCGHRRSIEGNAPAEVVQGRDTPPDDLLQPRLFVCKWLIACHHPRYLSEIDTTDAVQERGLQPGRLVPRLSRSLFKCGRLLGCKRSAYISETNSIDAVQQRDVQPSRLLAPRSAGKASEGYSPSRGKREVLHRDISVSDLVVRQYAPWCEDNPTNCYCQNKCRRSVGLATELIKRRFGDKRLATQSKSTSVLHRRAVEASPLNVLPTRSHPARPEGEMLRVRSAPIKTLIQEEEKGKAHEYRRNQLRGADPDKPDPVSMCTLYPDDPECDHDKRRRDTLSQKEKREPHDRRHDRDSDPPKEVSPELPKPNPVNMCVEYPDDPSCHLRRRREGEQSGLVWRQTWEPRAKQPRRDRAASVDLAGREVHVKCEWVPGEGQVCHGVPDQQRDVEQQLRRDEGPSCDFTPDEPICYETPGGGGTAPP